MLARLPGVPMSFSAVYVSATFTDSKPAHLGGFGRMGFKQTPELCLLALVAFRHYWVSLLRTVRGTCVCKQQGIK